MKTVEKAINVIGAGLAGSEAAWQLAMRGHKVILHEMKPQKFSAAHSSPNFAELVCSNSLKSNEPSSSSGVLKAELEMLDSLILESAFATRVPAGGALAVDREAFSALITKKIRTHKNIELKSGECLRLPQTDTPTIVATGPLTEGALFDELQKETDGLLYFFDASAPIVTSESIDYERCFFGARYGKGGDDYLNCPMTKEEYHAFIFELTRAEGVILKGFEKNIFEGCMPVEVMAGRGIDSLRFGPLKPVGFTDPATERRPYALVQLRREDKEGNLFNLVGFQTNLKFPEQKRVFSMIPALKNAEFVRYGVMHRNSFLNAPLALDEFFRLKNRKNVFIAGQLSGVEGYIESTASGLLAAVNADRMIKGQPMVLPPRETIFGALLFRLSESDPKTFQPLNSSFGLLPPLENRPRDKAERNRLHYQRAMQAMTEFSKRLKH